MEQPLPTEREKLQVQLLIKEYEVASNRYENIYKAVWTNFSYLAALSGGLLVFGANRLDTTFALLAACLPLIFWYRASFEPLNRYGDDTALRLADIESLLNRLGFAVDRGVSPELKSVGRPEDVGEVGEGEIQDGLNHWSKFRKRAADRNWPSGTAEDKTLRQSAWRRILLSLGVPTKPAFYEGDGSWWPHRGAFWIPPRARNRIQGFGVALHLISAVLFIAWLARPTLAAKELALPSVVQTSEADTLRVEPVAPLELNSQRAQRTGGASTSQRLDSIETKVDSILSRLR